MKVCITAWPRLKSITMLNVYKWGEVATGTVTNPVVILTAGGQAAYPHCPAHIISFYYSWLNQITRSKVILSFRMDAESPHLIIVCMRFLFRVFTIQLNNVIKWNFACRPITRQQSKLFWRLNWLCRCQWLLATVDNVTRTCEQVHHNWFVFWWGSHSVQIILLTSWLPLITISIKINGVWSGQTWSEPILPLSLSHWVECTGWGSNWAHSVTLTPVWPDPTWGQTSIIRGQYIFTVTSSGCFSPLSH